MPALEGATMPQAIHFGHETPNWSSPQRSAKQDVESIMDLTFNINDLQTPPVAVRVQPASPNLRHTPIISKPGTPVEVNTRHNNTFVNRDINNSPSTTNETASLSKLNSAQLTNDLRKPVSSVSVAPEINNPLLCEATKELENPVQPTLNGLQPNASLPHKADKEPSFNGSTESRRSSLAQNTTTAEAARLALNAAFQSQGVVEPRSTGFYFKSPLPTSVALNEYTSHNSKVAVPARASLNKIEPVHARTFQNIHKDTPLSRLQEALRDELRQKLDEELPNKSGSSVSAPVSSNATINSVGSTNVHRRTIKRKTFVLDTVVIDKRPPFSVLPASIRYKRDLRESSDDLPSVTKTGPPGRQKQQKHVRIRKPEIVVARTDEQLEVLLQADVGPCGYVSDEELERANGAIVANHEFLKLQWGSRQRTKDKGILKAASIVYPADEPIERFIKGLEKACGPRSLYRISQHFPKRGILKSVYTSSEVEESETEQVSDVPTEEEQEREMMDPDITMTEITGDVAINEAETEMSGMKIGEEEGVEGDGVKSVMNGLGSAGTLKRKLSSGPVEESRRTHPRLQDDATSANRSVSTISEKTIGRWVASLEVLIKGKVHLHRQDLLKLRSILDVVYAQKDSLSNQTLEATQLRMRIRQLSEMAAEEIPFSDEENLRQKARIINRFWIRRDQP